MTGLFALLLLIAVIVLCSVSLLVYPVGAITITSPTFQSTASIKVIVVLPGAAV
jgi:hypothetical protein